MAVAPDGTKSALDRIESGALRYAEDRVRFPQRRRSLTFQAGWISEANSLSFGYDTDGLLTSAGALGIKRSTTTGFIERHSISGIRGIWSYDAKGALSTYTATETGGDTLFRTSYVRDSLSRITEPTEIIERDTTVAEFTYDDAGRLETVTRNGTLTASYEYDANGNRLELTTQSGTVEGAYDDQDRMTSYGSATYTYGRNGELERKVVGTDTTFYTYDALGNLTDVILPDGTEIEYVIDPQNRRIGKKVDGDLVQGFLWQGQLAPVAELDSTGAVVSRFVYATRVNVPDYIVKGGQSYRLILDHLGSVRLVVSTTNDSVVQRIDYDEFGVVTQNTNPGFQPFGFAGGLYDEQTGLVRFGWRDYDAEVGRWTVKDPIGFGGNANLYAYAGNNPVAYVDPFGTDSFPADELRDGADLAAGFVPGVSTGLDAIIAATGFNPITGSCVGGFDRLLASAGFLIPGVSGGQLRGIRRAIRGGENTAARLGRYVHKVFYKGSGLLENVRLPSGRIADAVDFANRIVRELKPNNLNAVRRGERQVQRYADELAREFGGDWRGVVDTYNPSEWRP